MFIETHVRDKIVSSILLNSIQKLQITRLFSILSITKMKECMRVEGRGGGMERRFTSGEDCPPLPQVNSDHVHRDEIGEIVSSILLKGFQKLSGYSQSLLS